MTIEHQELRVLRGFKDWMHAGCLDTKEPENSIKLSKPVFVDPLWIDLHLAHPELQAHKLQKGTYKCKSAIGLRHFLWGPWIIFITPKTPTCKPQIPKYVVRGRSACNELVMLLQFPCDPSTLTSGPSGSSSSYRPDQVNLFQSQKSCASVI